MNRFETLCELVAAGIPADKAVVVVQLMCPERPYAGGALKRPEPRPMSADSVPVVTFSAGGPPVPGSAGAMLASVVAPGSYLDRFAPKVAAAARRAAGA